MKGPQPDRPRGSDPGARERAARLDDRTLSYEMLMMISLGVGPGWSRPNSAYYGSGCRKSTVSDRGRRL